MKSSRWVITYIVMASVGLWGALFMSLKFMTPGHAQTPPAADGQMQKMEPPAPGDLPPEFAQDTAGAGGKIPPPPSQPPTDQGQQPAQQAPPAQPMPPRVEGVPPPPPPPPPGGMPAAPTPPMVPAVVGGEMPQESAPPVVPQFASDDQYNYDPTGRRDPFKPYRTFRPTTPTTTTSPAKMVDASDPLQRWDLDRFAVVAIMWEIRQPKAMVRDPEGKMYMIGKNTKIGRNSGQVVAIREGEVVVVENIDNEGVQTKEVKILELKK